MHKRVFSLLIILLIFPIFSSCSINNESIDAIIAVHLYGQMQPLEKVGKSAAVKKIPIIEDAAQSLGATRFAMPSEGYSEFTCISFDPTKVIGAYGSGGAILTNNPELAEPVFELYNK